MVSISDTKTARLMGRIEAEKAAWNEFCKTATPRQILNSFMRGPDVPNNIRIQAAIALLNNPDKSTGEQGAPEADRPPD